MSTNCEHTPDVAAWMLGALEDSEAERLAAHLPGCDLCQAEASELAPGAEALAMAAAQIAPPDGLRERLMQTVRAEAQLFAATGPETDRPRIKRDRWHLPSLRPVFAGAAACALLAAGIVAGLLIDGGDDPVRTTTFRAQANPGMTAVAAVSGNHVTLRLDGMKAPPAGRVYQVWLERDGKVVPTRALFVPSGGKATVMVDEPLDGADRVMISDEPMGGSVAPTGEVYVDSQLS